MFRKCVASDWTQQTLAQEGAGGLRSCLAVGRPVRDVVGGRCREPLGLRNVAAIPRLPRDSTRHVIERSPEPSANLIRPNGDDGDAGQVIVQDGRHVV